MAVTRRRVRLGYCYRCGYVWRLRRRVPVRCARCKSLRFDQPKIDLPLYGGGLGIRELVDPHRKAIARLSRKYGARLAVFGSVARASAGPDSDIDLLVEWTRPADLLRHARLQGELARVLGRRVDLVTEDSLRWLIAPQVLMEMIPL